MTDLEHIERLVGFMVATVSELGFLAVEGFDNQPSQSEAIARIALHQMRKAVGEAQALANSPSFGRRDSAATIARGLGTAAQRVSRLLECFPILSPQRRCEMAVSAITAVQLAALCYPDDWTQKEAT